MKTIHEGPWIIFIIFIIVIDVFTHTKYLNHNSQRLHLPNIWNIVFDLEYFISNFKKWSSLLTLLQITNVSCFSWNIKNLWEQYVIFCSFFFEAKNTSAPPVAKIVFGQSKGKKYHLAWLTLFRLNMFRLVFYNYSLIVL